MTDFTNLIDWAKRVYPIENYDTYEEWESDVVEDLEDSGHMPKKTDNLFSQLESFWKRNKKQKPEPKEKTITSFADTELPTTEQSKTELPTETKSELPPTEPITVEPITPKPKPTPRPKELIPQKPKKKTIGERVKGGLTRFTSIFKRKKK
jgi:hypothetical protein